jgi:hypothetical protein
MTPCAATLPDQIMAGLDFQATLDLADYPATTWALQALLRGPQAINLTAAPNGTSFIFSAPAATTSTWQPGDYWFSLRATMGSAIMDAGSGKLTIVPDLATVTEPYDGRTQAAIALEAINAVLAKRATQDQQRYKINERELWRTNMADLLKLRAYYATVVARENAKLRGNSRFGRPVIVKFS